MATAETQDGVSFNPEDASGLLDSIRGKITKVVVDLFTATKGKNQGQQYVQMGVTVEGGGTKHTENYLLGNASEWAPNATKTGAIPLKSGGKVWNKSDVFAFFKSLTDAEPKFKALIQKDLSVIVGTDVDLTRVSGDSYQDEAGQTRTRSRMLVTKVYAMPGPGGAKAATKATAKASAPAAAAAPAGPADANDDVLTGMILEIVGEAGGSVAKDALLQPIFIKATRKKLSPAVRVALQGRAQDDAFLAGLAEVGLVQFDGTTLSAAAA